MASTETPATAEGGGKKKLIMIAAVIIAVAAGAYFFMKPAPAEGAEKAEPVPGVIVPLEPITINLAAGHYLKLGIALQPIEGAGHGGEVEGAPALDHAISLFSGKTVDELSKAEGREKHKKELVKRLKKAYHDEVYDLYFTEFVMQ